MFMAEDKLKLLLKDECVLCGSVYIDSVDRPFDSDRESQWSIKEVDE